MFSFLALAGLAVAIFQINQASARDAVGYFTQPNIENVSLDKQVTQLTVNDITVRLLGSHQNGENYQVDVCYTLPDNRDWLLAYRGNEVILSVQDKTFFPVEEGTIEWISDTDGSKIERCEYLLFPVIIDEQITNVKLSLQQISVSPPEALDCLAIQKELDEIKSEIKIRCNLGDGSSGVDILSKPENLTYLAAKDIVYNVIIDAHTGPWEFDISINSP
jgi:hypothetical protein